MTEDEFNALISDKKLMNQIGRRVGWMFVWELAKIVGPWIIGFVLGEIYGCLRTQWLIEHWMNK